MPRLFAITWGPLLGLLVFLGCNGNDDFPYAPEKEITAYVWTLQYYFEGNEDVAPVHEECDYLRSHDWPLLEEMYAIYEAEDNSAEPISNRLQNITQIPIPFLIAGSNEEFEKDLIFPEKLGIDKAWAIKVTNEFRGWVADEVRVPLDEMEDGEDHDRMQAQETLLLEAFNKRQRDAMRRTCEAWEER